MPYPRVGINMQASPGRGSMGPTRFHAGFCLLRAAKSTFLEVFSPLVQFVALSPPRGRWSSHLWSISGQQQCGSPRGWRRQEPTAGGSGDDSGMTSNSSVSWASHQAAVQMRDTLNSGGSFSSPCPGQCRRLVPWTEAGENFWPQKHLWQPVV